MLRRRCHSTCGVLSETGVCTALAYSAKSYALTAPKQFGDPGVQARLGVWRVVRVWHRLCSVFPCVLFRPGDGASGANCVVTSHALKKSETVKPHNHTQPTRRHNTTCTHTKNNTPHTAHITYAQPSQHTHTHTHTQNTPHQHNTAQPTMILPMSFSIKSVTTVMSVTSVIFMRIYCFGININP